MNFPLLRLLKRGLGTNQRPASDTPEDPGQATGISTAVTATSTGHIVDLRRGVMQGKAWQPVTLTEGRVLLLRSAVEADAPIDILVDWRMGPGKVPAAFAGSMRYFDAAGQPIQTPYAGCRTVGPDLALLAFPVGTAQGPEPAMRTIRPPAGAHRLEIRWRADKDSAGIVLAQAPRIGRSAADGSGGARGERKAVGATAAQAASTRPARRALAGWKTMGPIAVAPGDVMVWRARIEDPERSDAKAAVVSVSMADGSGRPVAAQAVGVSHSARFPNYFYVRSFLPETQGWHLKAFKVPDGVASLAIDAIVENGSPSLRMVDADCVALSLDSVTAMIRSWPPHRTWIDPAIRLARAAGQAGLLDELMRLLAKTLSSTDRAVPGWKGAMRIPVAAGSTLVWRARLEEEAAGSPKAALLAVALFDESGLPVVARADGLAHSERVSNYAHVASHARDAQRWSIAAFVVPEGACEVELDLRRQSELSNAEAVESVAVVLSRETVAQMLETWEPEEVWLRPALEFAVKEGDTALARRLVALQEKLRFEGLARPHGWRRPQNLRVARGDVLLWRARLEDEAGAAPKAAVMSILPYDEFGLPVMGKWHELAHSARFGNYVYVPVAGDQAEGWQFKSFVVQPGVSELGVELHVHAGSPALSARTADLTVLTLESIAAMIESWWPHEAWIEPALRLAQTEGALSLQMRLADLLVRCQGAKPEAVKLSRAVRAELEELDPDWYPRIEARRSLQAGRTLTVCHLHKTAYPFENSGGAIRCLNTLKSQLQEGLDPFVITPPGYPAYDGVTDVDVAPHDQVAGCDHFRIGPNTTGIRTLSPPARVRIGAVQAAAIVARRGAMLVHAASGVRGYELALQAFALRDIFDIPVIYEVRSFHEHTWGPAGPRIFDMERTQLRIRKENRCMEMADHVVTISESMRRILIERGVSEQRIDVIPNGIDAEEFREVPAPARIEVLEGAQLVVGYVSNMSKREGHRHLVEAVARVREGGIDCRCLFVGDGPERKALEQLVDELGLAAVVHFAGEIDHHEIKAYYMAIDVFVIPRIPDYAADWVTPLKPYEAMALGRPLIVTDLPALREVVGDGERGLLAPPSSADGLAEAILRYAANPRLRDETAARAREWVFEHRTWRANARRYREIYEQVISRYRETRGVSRSPNVHPG